MRVLLCSEGNHEGSQCDDNPQALKAIVLRVLPPGISCEWIDVHDLPRSNPMPGKGGGHFKLALKAFKYAMERQFDAVVLVTDADCHKERIKQFDEAQVHLHFRIPRAIGIAVQAFDAWILADQQAMSAVLDQNVPLQPLPENLDGGKGSARHPKQVCRKIMEQHGWTGRPSEFYAAVAAAMELDSVAQRCPLGFEPFLQRLRALAVSFPPHGASDAGGAGVVG